MRETLVCVPTLKDCLVKKLENSLGSAKLRLQNVQRAIDRLGKTKADMVSRDLHEQQLQRVRTQMTGIEQTIGRLVGMRLNRAPWEVHVLPSPMRTAEQKIAVSHQGTLSSAITRAMNAFNQLNHRNPPIADLQIWLVVGKTRLLGPKEHWEKGLLEAEGRAK